MLTVGFRYRQEERREIPALLRGCSGGRLCTRRKGPGAPGAKGRQGELREGMVVRRASPSSARGWGGRDSTVGFERGTLVSLRPVSAGRQTAFTVSF